jgi:hypothetical protein
MKARTPETKTMPVTDKVNHGGIGMWPSEEWASRMYDLANFGPLASLIAGVVSTWLIIWMGNVKEAHLRRYVADTNMRAVELSRELQGERHARIEIEERVAWRRLTNEQQSEIGKRLSSFSGQLASIWYNAGDQEGALFATDISKALQMAKFKVFAPASKLDFAGGGRQEQTAVETGVIVMSTTDETSRKASGAIVKELSALGFDTSIPRRELLPKRPEPIVIITVEFRPVGPQGEAKLRRTGKQP